MEPGWQKGNFVSFCFFVIKEGESGEEERAKKKNVEGGQV